MSCASQYRATSAAYARRTSRDAFSSVFTTSAVVAFVHISEPRVTMRAYTAATRGPVSGESVPISLSVEAIRSTMPPRVTRLGLCASSTWRPSSRPCCANRGRTTVCSVVGASVDSITTSGTDPDVRFASAVATPCSASSRCV